MKNKIYLVLHLFIIYAIFLFIEHGMTVTPGRISGNGNPALLLIFPLLILFVILIFQWSSLIDQFITKRIQVLCVVAISVVHWIIALLYQRMKFLNYKDVIAKAIMIENGDVDWEYIDSITTGLTIHVNNQYFNTNIFLMYVSLSVMISVVISVVKRKLKSRHDSFIQRLNKHKIH